MHSMEIKVSVAQPVNRGLTAMAQASPEAYMFDTAY